MGTTSAPSLEEPELVTLLLLPKLVIVIDCKENVQQQAFALSEIACHKLEEMDSIYLQIFLTGEERTTPRVSLINYTIYYSTVACSHSRTATPLNVQGRYQANYALV